MGLEIIITLAIALVLPGAAGITVAYSVWRERQPKALSWKERRTVAAKKRAKKKQAKLQSIEDARKAEQAEIEVAREKSAREIRELIEANRPKALLAAWDEEFKALAEPAITKVEYKEIRSERKPMSYLETVALRNYDAYPCTCGSCGVLSDAEADQVQVRQGPCHHGLFV